MLYNIMLYNLRWQLAQGCQKMTRITFCVLVVAKICSFDLNRRLNIFFNPRPLHAHMAANVLQWLGRWTRDREAMGFTPSRVAIN